MIEELNKIIQKLTPVFEDSNLGDIPLIQAELKKLVKELEATSETTVPKLNYYDFPFDGVVTIQARDRNEAIGLMTSNNSDSHLEKINQLILENVNFNY